MASDKRLGVQYQLITTNNQKVYRMQENILLGLSGLASDCETLYKKLRYKLNMYRIREGVDMTANTFAHLVGTTLYSHRWVFIPEISASSSTFYLDGECSPTSGNLG